MSDEWKNGMEKLVKKSRKIKALIWVGLLSTIVLGVTIEHPFISFCLGMSATVNLISVLGYKVTKND